ncbi:hypothetical protein [Pedobacter rhizosphaerae]|uniref:Lipoprotein n=1 Tax=Pedobacter rhizosphaerae TaxID=390241 RepID=A0A1H9U6U3_9SPHI|nr:hypothetical protein [Pedobacter rhizosphaerae]SES04867.1 hypothetical protein SAMN04488023_1282 [Pedobacter rhizosphaerae]
MQRINFQPCDLRILNKVKIIAVAALILIAGCNADSNKATVIQKVDSVALKIDSNPPPEVQQTDTPKKILPSPPAINEEAIQKAVISKTDSSFQVYNNIRADYRIIGYQSPDTNSRKMVLFSVFTSDVQDNPSDCPYGSYYGSPNREELAIKYIGDQGAFVKASINKESGKSTIIYFLRKWVEFE